MKLISEMNVLETRMGRFDFAGVWDTQKNRLVW